MFRGNCLQGKSPGDNCLGRSNFMGVIVKDSCLGGKKSGG